MPKISVVVITLNEESSIQRCLESVKDIADEIVIVDSFSTDRTMEICKQFNVRFIQHAFEGHIQQKNWALQQAHYNHILSLDADEEVSEELRDSILMVKSDWRYDGYYFNRLNCYCGHWVRHGGWYPDRKLRLWDKTKGQWGGLNPHDRFILAKGARKKFLKGELYHYSFNTIRENIRQINYFTTISAKTYFNEKKKSYTIGIIAHTFWRFFRDYLLKFGFLDGLSGFIISIQSAQNTFFKYIKLKQLHELQGKMNEKNG